MPSSDPPLPGAPASPDSEPPADAPRALLPDAVYLLDHAMRLVFANPAALRRWGRSLPEIVGRSLPELFPEVAGSDVWRAHLEAEARGVPLRIETLSPVLGCWLSVAIHPVEGGLLVQFRDVEDQLTPRQAADAAAVALQQPVRLRQLQGMAALGQVLGVMAHDLRNLLTAMAGHVELAMLKLPADAAARPLLEGATEAGGRARALLDQFLGLARGQPLAREATDLNRVVTGLARFVECAAGPGVRVVQALDPALGPALVNQGQLESALLNMVNNARDAMPAGGVLTITTRPGDATAATGPGTVELVVADTGVGMPPEVLERACEPFYSAKPSGTGLGLWQVFELARHAGGSVRITSEPDVGTAIVLRLPRAADATAG